MGDESRIDWSRTWRTPGFLGYLAIHLGCLGVLAVGWSPVAVATALFLYLLRMFAITGFYHRYFSHPTFRTSRLLQFVFAWIGASSGQRGPLWWAAHHRHHHRVSDQEGDLHSPARHGFWQSHMGWIWTETSRTPDLRLVRDLTRFPELRWLDRHHGLSTLGLAAAVFGTGMILDRAVPLLATSGPQMLVWGFCISTVALYHATYSINSLSHLVGSRRFPTRDDSRNNFWLALITLGEGWHNNHHHLPGTTRQGLRWWEIDATYYVLWIFERLGWVWNIQGVPVRVQRAMAAGPRRNRSGPEPTRRGWPRNDRNRRRRPAA